MKKVLYTIAAITTLNICFAQLPKPVKLTRPDANKEAISQGNKTVLVDVFKKDEKKIIPITQLDGEIVAATESILAKMQEVVNKANGFKDNKLTEVYNSSKVKGYYRNTNNLNGAIYYNTFRKKSVFIYGEIRKFFDSQGSSNSYIDFPVNDIAILKSGFDGQYGEYAMFEGACITIDSKKKLQAVFGYIYDRYRSLGGVTSKLGFPISERVKYTSNAYAQLFEGGMIVNSGINSFLITGKIKEKFNYQDCGLPLADANSEKANSLVVLMVNTQKFEKNVIVGSSKTPACFVKNEIYKKWITYGNSTSNGCGLPISDAADNGSLIAQNFEKGLMLMVNGKVTFVPDDNEKNAEENNKIRQQNKLSVIKFAPLKIN
jgi:hypothetical protein